MSLSEMRIGDKGIIKKLEAKADIKRRLLDIGLTEDTNVECVLQSPFGNPLAYLIRGAIIAIRKEDCRNIWVELV